ncbi:ribosome modulation factor [Alcanivorax hongdengensis]|nr:ribosome modulation factor [Alcanivorax hongdengensis]
MNGPEAQDQNAAREKAYNRGCMWGMSGNDDSHCPYQDEELARWWLIGWQDGHSAWQDRSDQQTKASC